jgi:hypothetical protein
VDALLAEAERIASSGSSAEQRHGREEAEAHAEEDESDYSFTLPESVVSTRAKALERWANLRSRSIRAP